jgi:hypothetical protein
MDKFVNLPLTREEYHALVRLIGHHTCGDGMQHVYTRLVQLRPLEATIAENMGPLCRERPQDAADLYGDRPVVRVGNLYQPE